MKISKKLNEMKKCIMSMSLHCTPPDELEKLVSVYNHKI